MQPGMFYKVYKPHPLLSDIVNDIMIFQCDFDKSKPMPVLPMPPLPEHRLFFYPYDTVNADYFLSSRKISLHGASLVGPQLERLNIQLGYRHLVIKVGFQPGALSRFLGIPMTELLQVEAFNAADIMSNRVLQLNEELKNETCFNRMKSRIDTFLMERMGKVKAALPVDKALACLVNGKMRIDIDTLAKQSFLSNRQFERLVKERTGFSPKFYARQARFYSAWQLKEKYPDISWTKIAYECGYYDQMHLIKDFKEFAGVSPTKAKTDILQMPFNPNSPVPKID